MPRAPKKTSATQRITTPDLGEKIPKSGTTAFIEFVISFRQINAFLGFLIHLVGTAEHVGKVAHETLLGIETDPEKRAKMVESWEKRRGALVGLTENRQFLMEVVLVRHVENYLNYLSSLLREIFLARPEALRSSEKIDLETVLKHESIEDLVRTVTERKVESLSYSSYTDLADYFLERFHITLAGDAARKELIDAIETRNISVHNRCVINSRYVSRTGKADSRLGKVLVLGIDGVEAVTRTILRSVLAVDRDARKRLKVQGHRLPKTQAPVA